MSRWPSSIPKEHRRSWVSLNTINKWFTVGDLQATSYIARAERSGNPIRHSIHNGSKRYRALDVIARARAECMEIKLKGMALEKEAYLELSKARSELEKELQYLKLEVEDLKSKESHKIEMNLVSDTLTGKYMLDVSEIVAKSAPFKSKCGVYFLIQDDQVVYVGQSVSVDTRVRDHANNKYAVNVKVFDRYAYIPCEKHQLDVLESLYIHALNPKYQGRQSSQRYPAAPFSFPQLANMVKHENTA